MVDVVAARPRPTPPITSRNRKRDPVLKGGEQAAAMRCAWSPPRCRGNLLRLLATDSGAVHALCQHCRDQGWAVPVSCPSLEDGEPIVVTHHGKPYALIQPLEEADLEEIEWRQFAQKKLAHAWEGEEVALYDYL